MSDRELIRLAAKAAGVNGPQVQGFDGMVIGNERDGHIFWNPLKDNGDALRLAVDLRMEVYHGEDEGAAVYASYTNPSRAAIAYMIEYYDDINNMGDPYAATRRAIVRAAAQIGENNGN
ncbi:hypothetical protein UFOVP37_12 [uncultured Caudovirales phage]|uniref:Uncharacterized protein n=1 Tax=uncultured Caudovirales phage TaxID=2100421 RepID=A0A6J5KML1_9CAUD|nr:hypothetical protein UFOVP37_12 [uncultured Caudovirales phage]